MGAFLNSLHVPSEESERVLEALRALDAGEPPRRELLLVTSGRWTSIFFDMLDSTDYAALSRALSAPVLHIMVADSDAAQMSIYAEGREAAALASPADFWERADSGDPVQFARVLGGAAAADQLGAIWKDDPAFAEDLVAATAELFGLERKHACGTREDFDREPGATRLVLGREPEAAPVATGAPRLEYRGHTANPHGAERLAFSALVWFANAGGPGRGLRVAVFGPGAERRLVLMDRAVLADGREASFAAGPNGIWLAQFPEAPIESHSQGSAPATWLSQRTHVALHGRFESVGSEALHVAIAPVENAVEGMAVAALSVRVVARGFTPASSVHSDDADADYLGLWDKVNLVAWLVLSGSHDDATAHAVSAFSRFHALLQPRADETYERVTIVPGKKPRMGHLAASRLSATSLKKLVAGASSLSLTRKLGDVGLQRDVDCMELALSSVATEHVSAPAAPHVGSSRVDLQACKLEYSIVSPK